MNLSSPHQMHLTDGQFTVYFLWNRVGEASGTHFRYHPSSYNTCSEVGELCLAVFSAWEGLNLSSHTFYSNALTSSLETENAALHSCQRWASGHKKSPGLEREHVGLWLLYTTSCYIKHGYYLLLWMNFRWKMALNAPFCTELSIVRLCQHIRLLKAGLPDPVF